MLALLSTLTRYVGVLALGAVLGSGATPVSVAARQMGNPPAGAVGRDVGAASCAHTLPTGASFGVIATTDGRPYYPSPCLAAEYAWAHALPYRAQYYLNLADPGHKSPHWAQGGPRTCHRTPKYDRGCAYDYGYEAAATAWGFVASVGPAGAGRWWLDVEVDNTWGYTRAGEAANRAVIHGALDYLRYSHHVSAGDASACGNSGLVLCDVDETADAPFHGRLVALVREASAARGSFLLLTHCERLERGCHERNQLTGREIDVRCFQ